MKLWIAIAILVIFLIASVTVANFFLPPEFVPTFNLAISTVFAALSALGSLLTIQEMRRERLERSQPLILVDFEVTNSQFVYWVVRNVGGGMARNLTFLFTPVPVRQNGQLLTALPFFQKPLSILAPGAEVRQLLGSYPKMMEQKVPMTFKAGVKYDWDGEQNVASIFDIDLASREGLLVPPKTINENLASIGKDIHDLQRTLNSAFWMSRLRVEIMKLDTNEQDEEELLAQLEEIADANVQTTISHPEVPSTVEESEPDISVDQETQAQKETNHAVKAAAEQALAPDAAARPQDRTDFEI